MIWLFWLLPFSCIYILGKISAWITKGYAQWCGIFIFQLPQRTCIGFWHFYIAEKCCLFMSGNSRIICWIPVFYADPSDVLVLPTILSKSCWIKKRFPMWKASCSFIPRLALKCNLPLSGVFFVFFRALPWLITLRCWLFIMAGPHYSPSRALMLNSHTPCPGSK